MMSNSREIVIDPVSRIEGHARITIQLDDAGHVADARFHVTQFRGFEKFCEGRPFYEMPSLMARTCGICPVSHLVAAAKACDALLAVRIPPAAVLLRRLMNLAQIVQSHALSFFYLSAPDLVLGMDAYPGDRSVFGLIQSHPELARDGIRIRKFGQQVIERLGGERIHPSWIVPGGVNAPLSVAHRDAILAEIPGILAIIQRTLPWYKRAIEDRDFRDEIRTLANFPSLFLSLVDDDGHLEFYDGKLRFTDGEGEIVADGIDPSNYAGFIREKTEDWTWLKSPYFAPRGPEAGMYRVGPLARLNTASGVSTPLAAQEWAEWRDLERGAVLSSFHYHHARLVEILHCLELMQRILENPEALSTHVRAEAGPNNREGVGVSEAPRGTLMHHYRIDEQGRVEWANLIIATGHNNLAMNRGVLQVARRFVDGNHLSEGMLNRVEAVIRCFDPCLSCSTHAAGRMPLAIDLVDAGGVVVDRISRS